MRCPAKSAVCLRGSTFAKTQSWNQKHADRVERLEKSESAAVGNGLQSGGCGPQRIDLLAELPIFLLDFGHITVIAGNWKFRNGVLHLFLSTPDLADKNVRPAKRNKRLPYAHPPG
jgi:hypothetical protein